MFTRFLFVLALLLPTVNASLLSPERIYDSPALLGDPVRSPKLSPDGRYVSYLKGNEDDFERLDLWAYDVESGKHRLLVAAASLIQSGVELSDEEKARRERLRLQATGIVSYTWSQDGKAILFPLNGDAYYWKVGSKAPKRLLATETFETDLKLSPKGNYLSFIRDQNLFILDIATGSEKQLTTDGKDTIKNGMAEFIMQEEFGRMTGYWWSEDERQIAFTRVDESPVEKVTRTEIYAESIKLIEQRYPFAGKANATIKLGVVAIDNRKVTWMDLGNNPDIYLPRIQWSKLENQLSFQVLSRDQKTLSLFLADANTGEKRLLLRETSKTWINIHDGLHFLDDKKHFIWLSEKDGFQHAYRFSLDGRDAKQLTTGEWAIDKIEHIDEEQQQFYFSGRFDSPLERQLYRGDLKTGGKPEKISRRQGMHSVTFGRSGTVYLDNFSSVSQPQQLSLHKANGEHMAWMLENKIDETHPLYPYQKEWITPTIDAFTTSDKTKLYYRLYKPRNFDAKKKYPAIVFVYGGPHVQLVTRSFGRSSLFLQYLAQQGYAVFTVDNRGSANRGKQFEEPIYQAMAGIEVQDQIEGVKFLKNMSWIDPKRIGVHGHSYGGYMTLMLMFQAPEHFKVGVSGAPVTTWALYDTGYTERYMGNPNDVPEAYEKSSVFPYANNLKGDLLIYHGMADDNVLFKHSTKLYKHLQENNLPFYVMDYPGKKHRIGGKTTQMHRLNLIKNFFDKNL